MQIQASIYFSVFGAQRVNGLKWPLCCPFQGHMYINRKFRDSTLTQRDESMSGISEFSMLLMLRYFLRGQFQSSGSSKTNSAQEAVTTEGGPWGLDTWLLVPTLLLTNYGAYKNWIKKVFIARYSYHR